MGHKLNSMDSWKKYVGGGTVKKIELCGWRSKKSAVFAPQSFFSGTALTFDSHKSRSMFYAC